jgi:hypothetical protein
LNKLKNNNYIPEEDFEKGEYKELIDKIRSVKPKGIPEEKSRIMLEEIEKEKYFEPGNFKTDRPKKLLFYKPRYYYAIAATLAIFCFSIAYFSLILLQTGQREHDGIAKNLFSSSGISANSTATPQKPIVRENYWKSLYNDVQSGFNYRSIFNESDVKNIVKSQEFREQIKKTHKTPTHKDTINIIIKIIKLDLF